MKRRGLASLSTRVGEIAGHRPAAFREDPSKKSGTLAAATAGRIAIAEHDAQSEVTAALEAVRAGEPGSKPRLIELIYDDLQSAARRIMKGERKGHTLQATALVNESLMRLMDTAALGQLENRGHLLAAATVAFKRVLIDHARARLTQKRGSGRKREPMTEVLDRAEAPNPATLPPMTEGENPFETLLEWYDDHGIDILAMDEALDELRELEERWFEVILLRFFGGFTVEQTAALLDVSPRTVAQDWNQARAWLRVRLENEQGRNEHGQGSGAAAPSDGTLPGGERARGG